jgi:hypothetical protein
MMLTAAEYDAKASDATSSVRTAASVVIAERATKYTANGITVPISR